MNYRVLLFLACLVISVLPLQARLGETPEACEQRYGPKLKANIYSHGFWDAEQRHEKNGIAVTVRFLRDTDGVLRAGYLEYKSADPNVLRLTEERTKVLMNLVSTNWTRLELLPLPAPLTNAPPDTARTMARTSKTKLITMEEKGGIAEERRKKEAAERKTLIESIEARNTEVTHIKSLMSRASTGARRYWDSPDALAAESESRLVVMSRHYLSTYERKVETSTSPLKGF